MAQSCRQAAIAALFALGSLFALMARDAAACLAHRQGAAELSADQVKSIDPLWIGPAFSGSWYNASRSGEGFIVQVQDDARVTAVWFTYPPAGETQAQQAWIFAQDGVINGDTIDFPVVFTTRGARFGADFDPSAVQRSDWGSLQFKFSDCNRGQVNYSGPPAWGSGSREIERLTAIDELGCAPRQRVGINGSRSMSGLKQRSAAWFDPSHTGEGWLLEELADGRALLYWFTYDDQGEQVWTIGIANQSGEQLEFSEQLRPVGTHFGADFDPAQVRREPWGSVSLAFSNCNAGQLDYASVQDGFGEGRLHPIRLNQLAGSVCLEATPASAGGGNWTRETPMPRPQSESSTSVAAGKIYVAGGFGDATGFKRYDPLARSWEVLAPVPAGRDHAQGTVIGTQVLYTGGYMNGGGDQNTPGWRYLIAENRWEADVRLPRTSASGAASLNGYAWIASQNGTLTQVDPRSGARRVLRAHPIDAPRDHSNLVAFQGELWLIGGRWVLQREISDVSIFDPASESWRVGPRLAVPRAGFAAAASATHILVAGGEVLAGTFVTLDSVEGISAGSDQWEALPRLLTPVHGTGGAMLPGIEQTFYVVAGSTRAGVALNTGEVQVYRWGL